MTVNRIWQAYFGQGLVETENDFGTQGTPPTHPELLDWLATEFVAQGWSLKAMHRLIVTSATYRQSSRVPARPGPESTPDNRLLARQSRLRLDAEVIRDAALAASGLLRRQDRRPERLPAAARRRDEPGPDAAASGTPSTGPDRYRRGLYTFFWRATPHPVADRSSTPPNAHPGLHPPDPLEHAAPGADAAERRGLLRVRRGAGRPRARRRPRRTTPGGSDYAFRLCLGRDAEPDAKRARLPALLDQERERGRRRDAPSAAAWTTVARVLLNLDEFITRE